MSRYAPLFDQWLLCAEHGESLWNTNGYRCRSRAMADAPVELESAAARVAASNAESVVQSYAVKSGVRSVESAPYVIGGLVLGAAALGYFARARRDKPRALPPPAPARVSTAQEPVALLPQENWFSEQWQMVKLAAIAWSDDYAPSMGAALSYYTLFSLAPLLIIVIAVAGMVFGQEAAQGEIVAQLRGIMGNDGAVAVEGLLKAARAPAQGIIATIVGITILMLGATAIFAELQNALDRIWRVPASKQASGIWHLLRGRLLSFGLVLGLGFLLIVSLVVSAVLAGLSKWWSDWFSGWNVFFEMLNIAVSFGIFTLLFAMIYKLMPRAKIPWRDVWTGAAVTALLFTLGKMLIGLYLGRNSLASGFGAAGSLVVLVAWVYYSAQIFLFGAEYTWVYANQRGSRAKKLATAQ